MTNIYLSKWEHREALSFSFPAWSANNRPEKDKAYSIEKHWYLSVAEEDLVGDPQYELKGGNWDDDKITVIITKNYISVTVTQTYTTIAAWQQTGIVDLLITYTSRKPQSISANEETGAVDIVLNIGGFSDQGILSITRSPDFTYKRTVLAGEEAAIIVSDICVEPGKYAEYEFFFEEDQIGVSRTLIPIFEDAYLLEPDKTMRIKYNPEVSSLKRNFVDVITPTLGSETPFIRRAGKQKYKTFTLGGLISIEAEAEERAPINNYSLLTDDDKELLEKIDNMQLSTYDARAVKEKLYRERILDFLEDGKVKLFKSVQEGNIWVYLSGVTLTADKPSARNLYSFSCTATEVAPDYAGYYSSVEEG